MEYYRNYGYAFIALAFLAIGVALVYPMLSGISLSLHHVALDFTVDYAGLANYRTVLASRAFWQTLGNTLFFATVSTMCTLVVGLGMALLLNYPGLRCRTFWRVLFLMPWTISNVAAGLGWKWILDTLYGVLNDMLLRLGIIAEPVLWLASRDWAMTSVIVANVWRSFPFLMLLLLAGLQAIPREQYESAAVDGATAWRRFLHVTLPNLRFLLFVGTVLDFIFNVRQFDLIYVMTRGGPRNATEVLPTLVNRQAFEFLEYGQAAATAVLMLALLMLCTLVYMRVLKISDDRR